MAQPNQLPPSDPVQAEATANAQRNSWQATNPLGGQDQAANNLANGATPDMQQQQQSLVSPEQAQAFEHTAMAMLNPVEILKEQSETKTEEVSLETLSKKQKEKILASFLNCKKVAKSYYETVVEPAVKRRRAIYEASEEHYKSKYPQLSEMCGWTSRDVKVVCDCILPSLMEAFTGCEYPLSVKGVNADDDERAEKIQQLVTYQLERKNAFQPWVHAEANTALKENWAIAKVYWKREEAHTPMEMMMSIDDQDASIALMNAAAAGLADIKKMEPLKEAPDLMKVEYTDIRVKANHPVVEFLPSSEFRFTPDAPELQGCKFVAQRKIVTGDYLKRKEIDGIYKNIDKALEEYGEGDTAPSGLDQDNDLERSDKSNRPKDDDKASKEVELYEAYINVDYNDDGISERLIVHAVGDNLIRVANNDFEEIPFFICCSDYDPNRIFPLTSMAEAFEQQQDLKTAMIRQVIINTSKNNAPRIFVNEQKTDMDALISGDEVIPTQGNPNELIMTPPSLPLSSITMELINYAQNEIEAQSGSTRYNQGLDSNSLNKTATGVTAIMGAAEKRNKLMARAIAERFFIPIFKFIIKLNQMYLEDEQMVRLTNQNVTIRREDLDIDYDLIVNVGQGAGTREAQIQYLMYTLQSLYPQLVSMGIANSKSFYNLVCKLLEALGLRDTTSYLMDPDSPEAQAAAQQAQQQAIDAQAEALKNSLALAAAKVSMPRVAINMNEMPPDVVQQYLQEKLGIETTEKAIAQHEVFLKND